MKYVFTYAACAGPMVLHFESASELLCYVSGWAGSKKPVIVVWENGTRLMQVRA